MPSKAQPEVNLWFLYICLQKSDYKTIDFQAVSRETNFTPAAARRRFARLKKQIEKSASDSAKETPAPPEQNTKATQKPTTKTQPPSEAAGPKQPKHEPVSAESSLGRWNQSSEGVAPVSAQTPALSRQVQGLSGIGCHAVHVDLTKEHDDGARLNADDSSDDDAPLMKKRRLAGVFSGWRKTQNHKPTSMTGNEQKHDFPGQAAEGHPSQSLSSAHRTRIVKEHQCSKEGQYGTDPTAGIVTGASVTAAQRTAEPQMIDLTGDEPPVRINNGVEGTSGMNAARGSSIQEPPDRNGTDILPSAFSDQQDLSLFGDELFTSFLGSTSDFQNGTAADVHDDYDPITNWQQPTSPLSSLGRQVSSALPQALGSRRESFMSIDDERPAYSWALRRLDRPDFSDHGRSYEQ